MKVEDKQAAIEVGQVFEDNDKRMKGRRVRVTFVDGLRVGYVRCLPNGRPVTHNGRVYTASISSFFRGGGRGFSLVARNAE